MATPSALAVALMATLSALMLTLMMAPDPVQAADVPWPAAHAAAPAKTRWHCATTGLTTRSMGMALPAAAPTPAPAWAPVWSGWPPTPGRCTAHCA